MPNSKSKTWMYAQLEKLLAKKRRDAQLTPSAKTRAWRKKNPDKWQAMKKRYYRKTAWALNHHKKWSYSENAFIMGYWPFKNSFSRVTDTERSHILGRSVAAIQTQRNRLKK